jgi:hypothetical protein
MIDFGAAGAYRHPAHALVSTLVSPVDPCRREHVGFGSALVEGTLVPLPPGYWCSAARWYAGYERAWPGPILHA